jgi:hypothetical protein
MTDAELQIAYAEAMELEALYADAFKQDIKRMAEHQHVCADEQEDEMTELYKAALNNGRP